MDCRKRKALIEWVNALVPECSINSLLDLSDGKAFIQLLELSDDCFVQELEAPKNVQDRFTLIKQYLEGFFSLKFDDGNTLLDFHRIHQEDVGTDEKEWNLGKLLLALLEACVLEKKNDKFVTTATSLPECIQLEIMQMLQPMIINSQDIGNQLTEDFADILTKSTVTQGNLSRVTSTPNTDHSFNFSRLSNNVSSPVSHYRHINTSLGTSIHEIASPLRMLTIANSPVTPLGALMHSPQLAQKALIRQKEREIKKLELSLQNERHLRTELEFDIQEKTELLNEKDNRIKEFEKAIRQQRHVQDMVDELDNLRIEKEKNEKDLARLQSKMNELLNIKEHCSILEQENKQLTEDISKMRTEVQTMESLKKSHEEYRTQCHIQTVKITEIETMLQHRTAELTGKNLELTHADEKSRSLTSQVITLKKEKEDIEELLSCRDILNGESMGVITDKRIKDLEGELSQMKSRWIEPSKHELLHQKLLSVTEAKETFESKYIDVHKKFLEKDGQADQLKFEISQLKSNLAALESCKSELDQNVKSLEMTVDQLKQSESRLMSAEEAATIARKMAEDQILNLQKDLLRVQSELKFTVQELESTKLSSENRRQTLAASYDAALSEKTTSEQRLLKENQKLGEQVSELKAKLQMEKEEGAKVEASLNMKIQTLQSSVKQSEILLENEKWTKDNVISAMREELKELQNELIETEKRLKSEVTKLTEIKCSLEDQLVQQKDSLMQTIDQLNEEFDHYKSGARQKENDMCNKIQDLKDDNVSLKNEIENIKNSTEKTIQNWEQKYSKLENKAKDQEEIFKKELKELNNKHQWSLHDQQSLSDEISDLKDNIKEKCSENENLQNKIISYKQSETDLKGQLSQLVNCRENLQKQLKELQESLATERESHAELLNKISHENKNNIQKLKDSLSAKEASSLDTQQNLQTCINELRNSLEKEMEKRKEVELSSVDKIAQFENHISELQKKMDDEAESHCNVVTTLNNELEQLRMSTAVSEELLNKELQKCRTDLTKNTAEYNELNVRYRSVTENERNLDGRLNELHQQITNLETQKKACETRNEKLNEKIDDLMGQVALIKKVAESKQSDNDKLCSENKNMKIKLEELSEKWTKECKENDSMRHKCKEQKNKMTSLESELTSVQIKLNDTSRLLQEKSGLYEKQTEVLTLREAKISELTLSLQTIKEDAVINKEQVETLEQEKSRLNEKLNCLDAELKNLQEVFSCKEIEFSENIQTLTNSHNCDVEELKKGAEQEAKQLNSEIERLKSDLLACDAEINKLEQQVKNLQSSLEFLKEENKQSQELLNGEKDEVVKNFQSKISDIQEKFSKVKNELVESHKAKLNSLKAEYSASIQQLRDQAKSESDSLNKEFKIQKEHLQEELNLEKEKVKLMENKCDKKVAETEKYWQSQLEELEGEYHRASQEQKQEYNNQIQEQEMRYQSQYEALVQEKEMLLSSQKLTFQERVKHLETRLSQKQTELQTLTTELNENKEKTETDYKQKLTNIESILKKEMANQKDLMNELKQNKERVNELQAALREKRTSYEASLAASSKSWESQIENLREEYNSNMSKLEREKNRQIQDEKQQRLDLEESCHHLNERIETSLAENNSLKQQLAAVEEEKNQLVLDYEKTLDQKTSQEQEKLKIKIEYLKSQVQKFEVEANFHKDQLNVKIKEMKEELEYKENHWSEQMESCMKQYTEANQQKIHLQQQMKNIEEESEKKDKIIMQYKKHYAQKKDMNQMLQQEVAVHQKLAENFKSKAEKLEDEVTSLKTNYNKKSEKLESELELLKSKIDEQKQKFNKAEIEVAPLKAQLQEELNKNKALQNKVKCLEVQLDFADKQVREFRNKLDEAGTALLGDNTEFLKMKKESDVSLMETLDDGPPLTPYDLRSKSRTHSLERTSQTSLKHISSSDGDEKNASPMSLRSHGRRTSLSDPNLLNSTIASVESVRSTTARGMKRFVNEEDDEGEVLEWKRLGELSRRNTLCLPHLKTSYPIETQKIQLRAFPDQSLKESHLNQENLKKRKQEMVEEDILKTEFYDSTRNKQAKHGTLYQKPGPPTPGNTNRRNSRGTPGRGLHSPRSPLTSGRRKGTPKRTPKRTPSKSESNENSKPSTSFSIGFTPKNKRLTRQQGFVTSSTKSSSKGHKHRQPLAVKNCFQQTGV